MFSKVGTDNVRGAGWCRVGGAGHDVEEAYKDSLKYLHESEFLEDINTEFGPNLESYAKNVTKILAI